MAYEDEEDLNYDDYENKDEEYPQNHHKNYNYDDDDYEYDDDNNDDDFYEMD
ncbi:highly acidic protein [Campylobacter jejuni]|uniref:Highly acidic protein n=1 Tax=Campylobacter jejuni TaxID=197 RepID=A0A5Y8XQV5_CAMJU|nr:MULTISPECIES: highly acidic protein [Campylobacter]EAI3414658.1 highly acidic protein [Campylobacter jejuni]ECL6492770.1 highly acidic protein [Campylobacter jejuni]ECQ0990433.1 highly acidic protein [Campylobacter jejuni]ECQ5135665.1 highly acidic protein [Campylobacter jejuni]ECQ5950827.1 highly acidic protein [Campylobacter jejuni]